MSWNVQCVLSISDVGARTAMLVWGGCSVSVCTVCPLLGSPSVSFVLPVKCQTAPHQWSTCCQTIVTSMYIHTSGSTPGVGTYVDTLPCLCKHILTYSERSQDNAVGTATGYGMDDRGAGVRVPVGSVILLSSPHRPDRLWGPPNLLYSGYRG
jgi:hypothetical protein